MKKVAVPKSAKTAISQNSPVFVILSCTHSGSKQKNIGLNIFLYKNSLGCLGAELHC